MYVICSTQTHALVTCESRQETMIPHAGLDDSEQLEPIERGTLYMYMDVHACMNLKIKRRQDWSIYEL